MALSADKLKEISAAKQRATEGRVALWNLRLDALAGAGDMRAVLDLIGSTVEDNINNCGCNVQCGALQDQIGGQLTGGGR